MSGSLVPVTQEDRKEAWPLAQFHCLPDRQMRERWFAGFYDTRGEGAPIRTLARHRIASQAELLEALAGLLAKHESVARSFDCPKVAAARVAIARARGK